MTTESTRTLPAIIWRILNTCAPPWRSRRTRAVRASEYELAAQKFAALKEILAEFQDAKTFRFDWAIDAAERLLPVEEARLEWLAICPGKFYCSSGNLTFVVMANCSQQAAIMAAFRWQDWEDDIGDSIRVSESGFTEYGRPFVEFSTTAIYDRLDGLIGDDDEELSE